MSLSGPVFNGINVRTPVAQTAANADESTRNVTAPVETPAVKVDLSSAGKAASSASSRNADIEQSGLPESVQKILKAVRELQRKIQETMEQLQKVLSDKSLTYDERQTKATALQTVLGMLQRQISNSTADLSILMNQLQSSDSDKIKAGILVMAKM
ncbi:chemotaxis protein [Pseudomonas sp. v388]|uniref:chemotaxis protein n=1 Tax=Pseudomonas sp. v388 TaxID=2479849 RepID=UPI000F79FA85|nr:chemotaxis protein [Pseudomonas sp. v388]RRV05643.1 chemotaxis protein [Pseudomonas sp. v388]